MDMLADNLYLLLVAVLLITLIAGFPVAFTLTGVSLGFAGIGYLLGVFDVSYLYFFPNRIYGLMTNDTLVAIPLFIFMGMMLDRSKVAEELLETMGRLFGTLPGGLAIAVCIVGMLLAASTGVVGAAVVSMGLISLPTMLRWGYNPALACGLITASGTLGQVIPPSIVLIVLGDLISNGHLEAQRLLGNHAPEPVSVADLFAGALIPGLVLPALYILYVGFIAWLKPSYAPSIPADRLTEGGDRLRAGDVIKVMVAPILLIIAVLGSILTGIATPTEAAAVGAMGAIMLGAIKQYPRDRVVVLLPPVCLIATLVLAKFTDLRLGRSVVGFNDAIGLAAAFALAAGMVVGIAVSLGRAWQSGALQEAMRSTARISAMIFGIVIGAQLFALVFRGLGGEEHVNEFLSSMPGGAASAVFFVMAAVFVLGFFLDTFEIMFIVVPIVAPPLLLMGIDPVWLGIMFAVNLQTSFLTPPFGFALFYLRGVAPSTVSTGTIYRGAIPFVIIQLLMLVLLTLYPGMATWLPRALFS